MWRYALIVYDLTMSNLGGGGGGCLIRTGTAYDLQPHRLTVCWFVLFITLVFCVVFLSCLYSLCAIFPMLPVTLVCYF